MKFPKNLASIEKPIFLIIAFVAFFSLIGVSTGCNCTDSHTGSGLKIGMANPAAVYCEELGYEYKIITDDEGGQRGVCIFPDNSSCDAWDFFAGKCGQNYSYCKIHGCDIETIKDGKNPYSPEYAVCTLPNKTKTSVMKLMNLDKKISAGSIPIEYKSKNVSEFTSEPEYFGVETPTTFDWRNKDGKNWMTPVQDQGSCGSCWAFATVGGVEAKINIARNDSNFDANLSEQDLVSCGVPKGFYPDLSDGGCGGAYRSDALNYTRETGIADEPCFPYMESDCPCSYRCSAWDKRLWKIDDYGSVPAGRENMKSYLIEKGPLVVSLCMNGYWDEDNIYRCDKTPGDPHAIVIVGYNDIEGCWIAKNSWGIGWWSDHYSPDGYFKIGYGECLIEELDPLYLELTKEQAEEVKADDIQVYTGSKSGTLDDTYHKDGDYITLSEQCYTISCDGLYAIIRLPVGNLTNVISMDLTAYHRARWEDGFSLHYWDKNNDRWSNLGGIPDSTWHLMRYKICDSESECASYLSSGEVLIAYFHPSCSWCDTDHVDIDWLYLETYSKKMEYCPASTDSADSEWINKVALNTGERISGSSTYSDFTEEVLTTIKRGDTSTLQVDGHTTLIYTELVKAWIDFNNDNDFIDAGEEIDLGNYTFEGDHTFSANFKVPNDAVLSDTRMRVCLKYDSAPFPCENDSENTTYGEVEDYTIKIISPAVLTDNYLDYGEDTDGDGYYDNLLIDVGVDVTEPGYYGISGWLYDELGNYVSYDSSYTYLYGGNQSITLKFSGIEIRANGESGTFDLKHLYLENNSYNEVDYRYDAYTTFYYSYTDFQIPPVEFNDVYSDYGEDTDGDGYYNYLVVDVGVDVLDAGDYRVSGELYENGTYNYVDSDSSTIYLNEGSQTVQLMFEGTKVRNNEYNGIYDLNYLELYNATYPVLTPTPTPDLRRENKLTETESVFIGYDEQLDYEYHAYTTSHYNYTEFEESTPDAYEPDDNYSFASYISVDGTKQTHNFHVPDDQDWLKFNAAEGSSCTIETSELWDDSDTYLYLYATDGTTEMDHDDDGGIDFASKIVWNCSISGTYYVMAQHYSSSAFGPETKYNISVTCENQPPTANFIFSPENPFVNQAITFNASDSTDPDGNIVSYEWDFGDENTTITTEKTITHSYVLGGDYNVNLTVTDDDGATDSVSKTITIAILRGDVNRDGAITSTDAAIVLGVAVRGEYDADADVSGDGSVTSLDALMILQAARGAITL